MSDKFLDKAYGLESVEETLAHYDKWAESYETELADNGYATPTRLAAALWDHLKDPVIEILDYGCGTGLCGVELRRVGFSVVDGVDPSPEMLSKARQHDAYRDLSTLDISVPAPVKAGRYPVIVACGVIGVGAAPPETLDLVMNALPKGGILAFSFNDHAIADRAFEGRLNGWLDPGAARLLVKEYGPHLPNINLSSNIYIVEKA